MLPATAIFSSLPWGWHGLPRSRLVNAVIKLRWIAECSDVPPVIATGWNPSNS